MLACPSVTCVTARRSAPFSARRIADPGEPRHLNCIVRAHADAMFFAPTHVRQGQNRKGAIHSQAGGSTSGHAEPATGTPVFIDDGQPFVGECHDGWENAGLVSGLATAGHGGGSSSVMPRLTAKRVTAVSSVTADIGRICHAARIFASYAGTSEATRSRQPRFRIAREAPMSRLLYRSRIPQNAGSTLWPIAKTIVERNPTVRAWREAPQTPPWVSASAAYKQPDVSAANESRKRRGDPQRFGGFPRSTKNTQGDGCKNAGNQ